MPRDAEKNFIYIFSVSYEVLKKALTGSGPLGRI
jgi:hypothetical protein